MSVLASVRLESQSALLRHPRLIEASQRSRAPHQLWKLGSFNELRLSLGVYAVKIWLRLRGVSSSVLHL